MSERQQLEQLLNNPNTRKMLDLIANAEGVKHGYNTGFGNERIASLGAHPNVKKEFTQTDGKKNVTTAAGRYQFLKPTWDGLAKQYGFKDFSPRNQDLAALALIAKNGAMKNVINGDFKGAVGKLGGTWASLPSSNYAQPKKTYAQLGLGGGGVQKATMNDLHALFQGGAKAQKANSTGRQLRQGFASDIPPELRNTAPVSQGKKVASNSGNMGSMNDLHSLFAAQKRANYQPFDNTKEARQKREQEQLKKQGPTDLLESASLAAADIGAPVLQGFSYLGDKISAGINKVAGTNLRTDSYEGVTKGLKTVNNNHETVRKANNQGVDTGRIAASMLMTAPLAGAGGALKAGMPLASKAGAAFLGRNAAVGGLIGATGVHENNTQRLQSMGAGAIGGVVGGVAGRGLEKISQNATQKITQKATQKALDAPKNTLVANARNTGYSVPPSYSNPNFINKSLAKVAGEADLARIASAKNQQVTNNLARKSVGLADDQPITVETLGEVRKQAGQAYKVLKGFGDIQTDRKFAKDLAEITKNYTSAGRDFNIAGGDRIQNVVNQIRGDRFGSDAALNMIKIVRNDASAAFRAGDTDLGLANQKLASAIEGQLERAVVQNTKVPRAAVANFVNARKVIAKTYSIENALDATGNVSARKLASTLGKKPLTGELKQAAQFSQAYPQLNNVGVHGGNGITLFDSLVGIGGGVATGNPAVAALTLGRPALKAGLNSTTAGKLMGTPSYSSALLQLMGQSGKAASALPVAGATAAKEKNKSKPSN